MKGVPQDLADALEKAGLSAFFSGCTASHRREYLLWIGGAKKPETRAKRITGAVERISAKRAEEEARARRR
jgi:uncharacterized protein YdeI (YjbR/CyaY-like superfamily)